MTDACSKYDELDAAFFATLGSGASPAELVGVAEAALAAANLWEAEAYATFFSLRDRLGETHRDVIEAEISAEKAETLRELWADLASALAASTARSL